MTRVKAGPQARPELQEQSRPRTIFLVLNAVLVVAMVVTMLVHGATALPRRIDQMQEGLSRNAVPLFRHLDDFTVFYAGAKLAREGRIGEIYEPTVIVPAILEIRGYGSPEVVARNIGYEPFLRYYNPPVWALLTAPVTLVSPHTAYRLLTVLNLFAVFALVVLCSSILSWRPVPTALLALAILTSNATLFGLQFAQPSAILTIAVGSAYYVALKRPHLAGALLATAAVKLQFLPFNALGLFVLNRRTLVPALAVGSMFALPFLLIGPDGIRDYISLLRERADRDMNEFRFTALVLSWPGFFTALNGEPVSPVFVYVAQALTLAVFAVVLFKRDPWLIPLAAAIVSVIANPHSHNHDWVLLAPGAAFLIARPSGPLATVVTGLLLFGVYLGVNSWIAAGNELWRQANAESGGARAIFWATPAAALTLLWLAALPFLERTTLGSRLLKPEAKA